MKKIIAKGIVWIFTALFLFVATFANAQTTPSKTKSSSYQRVIDFDGDLVEGMNKQPWDSLSQLSEKNKKKRSHLYHKRKGFRTETQEALFETRYLK